MESVNLKSVFSAQFYEVLISNIPMSSPLTSTTYFLKDLTHGEVHSSRFVLLKQPHHWEKLLFNLQPQQGCSSAGFFSLHHPACAVLHLPPLLSLVPLAAGAAWLGVPEAVSRHLPLLEVSRSNSSVLMAQSEAAEGSQKSSTKFTGEFCPCLVEKAWIRAELMSSRGCIANSHVRQALFNTLG